MRKFTSLQICYISGLYIYIYTAGYTLLNHKINEEILEELHVTSLEDKLCTYRHKWFQHVHRMEDNMLPKQLLNYHPKVRRQPERPRKRLLDDMTAETETDHAGLNTLWNMIHIIHVHRTEKYMRILWKFSYGTVVSTEGSIIIHSGSFPFYIYRTFTKGQHTDNTHTVLQRGMPASIFYESATSEQMTVQE
jgi:hypothetical protein